MPGYSVFDVLHKILCEVRCFNVAKDMLHFVNCLLHEFVSSDFCLFLTFKRCCFQVFVSLPEKIIFSIVNTFHFEKAPLAIKYRNKLQRHFHLITVFRRELQFNVSRVSWRTRPFYGHFESTVVLLCTSSFRSHICEVAYPTVLACYSISAYCS